MIKCIIDIVRSSERFMYIFGILKLGDDLRVTIKYKFIFSVTIKYKFGIWSPLNITHGYLDLEMSIAIDNKSLKYKPVYIIYKWY